MDSIRSIFTLVICLGYFVLGQVNLLEAQKERIIHEPTGIEIIFAAENGMFPQRWTRDPINAQATPLISEEVARSITIVNQALNKYPVSVVQSYLERVYVLGSISFYGQVYGGTNSDQTVYLSNRGKKKGYSQDFIEKLFHAEFSSILLRKCRNNFDKQAWRNTQVPDFSYGTSGVDALKNNTASERFNSQLHLMGFLNQYGTSTLENDFNSYAKQLFTGSSKLWELYAKYPLVKTKVDLTIGFYSQLDTGFTHDFFRSLAKP